MYPYHFFSDGSEMFRTPAEPAAGQTVRIRLRADRTFRGSLFLISNEKKILMTPEEERCGLRYYAAEITLGDGSFHYHFEAEDAKSCEQQHLRDLSEREITADGAQNESGEASGTFLFGANGLRRSPHEVHDFRIVPGMHIPDWAKGTVIYQIFPDRFCNGCRENDVSEGEYEYYGFGPVKKAADWSSLPEQTDVIRFYGGDLQGIEEKLPYLKSLGVECIYLNPIFVSPSNHKYDVQDYRHVDPHLSDTADPDGYFSYFIEKLHENGIRVILDGVFNHCGITNSWVSDPEKRSWFYYEPDGSLKTWWGIPTLPKLNYESAPELVDEILSIGKKWLSEPYNADGWRLDVAPDLTESRNFNRSLWKLFHAAVRSVSPEALIVAETYEDPSDWLEDTGWDTVMNYEAFMDPVSFFFTGVDKHSDESRPHLKGNAEAFYESLVMKGAALGFSNLLCAMNSLDNHDHSRFITRTGGHVGRAFAEGTPDALADTDAGILRLAALFQFTWPGAPCIYYGDETGIAGYTDPDNRRTFPWGREDWALIDCFAQLSHLRKRFFSLKRGSVYPICFKHGIVAFGRFFETEAVVTVINMGDPQVVVLDLSGLGTAAQEAFTEFRTGEAGINLYRESIGLSDGRLVLGMEQNSGMVLSLK